MLNLYDSLNDKDLDKLSEIITPNQVQSLVYGDKVARNLTPLIIKAPRISLKILAKLYLQMGSL